MSDKQNLKVLPADTCFYFVVVSRSGRSLINMNMCECIFMLYFHQFIFYNKKSFDILKF